jgi:multimeric flavodoxin WrbA
MLIVSSSNVTRTRDKSQSLETAQFLAETLAVSGKKVEVADMRRFDLAPCTMCEKCEGNGRCKYDSGFNKLHELMMNHDEYIFVIPHYAGIPAKLVMLCEKLQEMSYLSSCMGKANMIPYPEKKACIIAHGGMTGDYDSLYTDNLLVPMGNILRSLGMKILNDGRKEPLCFGVKEYSVDKEEGSHCFRKVNDREKQRSVLLAAAEMF